MPVNFTLKYTNSTELLHVLCVHLEGVHDTGGTPFDNLGVPPLSPETSETYCSLLNRVLDRVANPDPAVLVGSASDLSIPIQIPLKSKISFPSY